MIRKQYLAFCGLISVAGLYAEQPNKVSKATKMAVVDYQRIANPYEPEKSEALEYKDLMAKLQKDVEKREGPIREKQAEYQKKAAEHGHEIEKAQVANKLKDADTQAKLKKSENALNNLKQEIQIDAQAVQQYVEQESGKFNQKVKDAVEDIRKKQGWTHVAPAHQFISYDKDTDISEELLDLLNKNYRSEQRSKKFVAGKQ